MQLVELSNQVLEAYAYCDVSEGTRDIANALADLLKSHTFQSKHAILAIPDALSISKILQVSANLHPHEIEACVRFDLEQQLPYPLDEVYFDFQILGVSCHAINQLDVLLVASKIQNIQQRVEIVERAGLIVDAVELESHAVMRAIYAIGFALFQKTTVLIDVRAQTIACFIFENAQLVFLREEPFDDNACCVRKSEQLFLHIKRELQLQASTNHGKKEAISILLTGQHTDLVSLLESHFNQSIQYVNPFSALALSPTMDADLFKQQQFRLLVAYGLALRGGYDLPN